MPGRKIPLVTNEIYHVFNRGINRQPTFTSTKEYQRAVETIAFYRFDKPPLKLSEFLRLENTKRLDMFQSLVKRKQIIEIFCFCLMPNHFHFLLKQSADGGIAKFIGNLQNSYTRYFNTRSGRDGSLFLDQFKAVRIETDEQAVHVSRYIHLNPYTEYVVKSLEELEKYQWSSFPDYLKGNSKFVAIKPILSFFGTSDKYKKFVFDQADFQRRLKEIEHLTLRY